MKALRRFSKNESLRSAKIDSKISLLKFEILHKPLMNDRNESLVRTRTISWEDPHAAAEAGRSLSGIEYLLKIIAGELPPPPMGVLMNFQLSEIEEGRAVFTVEPAEYHYNPNGVAHGGLAATLLDSALGCAVYSHLPAGVGYTTLEIKVNYLRPILHTTGQMRAEARTLHVGRSTAMAEATLTGADDKLYAHATTTCIIFRS